MEKFRSLSELDLSVPFVAMKEFRSNGRLLKSGDSFEWRNTTISVRRVKQLYVHRFICYESEWLASQRDKEVARNQIEQTKVEVDTPVVTDSIGGYTIVKYSLGWYNVIDSKGNKVNDKGLRKGEAEDLILSLTTKKEEVVATQDDESIDIDDI